MLNSFSWVFVLFLLLEIIFLEVFNHFLSSGPQLTIELYHGHILDHEVIRASPIGIPSIRVTSSVSSSLTSTLFVVSQIMFGFTLYFLILLF